MKLAMKEDEYEYESPISSEEEVSDSSPEYLTSDSENGDDNEQNDTVSAQPTSLPAKKPNRKSTNVDTLLSSVPNKLSSENVEVKRQSLFPRLYSVTDAVANLRKPFKPPTSEGYNESNEQLSRRLSARKRFVPWGSTTPVLVAITNQLAVPEDPEEPKEIVILPPEVEPLVLWHPEESGCGDSNMVPIEVEPLLVKFLRPHQREGVQFMFECVSGQLKPANISGCILADDMGLGKTLQSITLLYTLLRQGFDGKPMVKKAIIVTPTSLVSNWEAEIKKWVGERVNLVALCESSRDDVVSSIDRFVSPRNNLQVLIVSYETFRMHSAKFSNDGSCDLLICDEAHRLKNDQTLTNRALAALTCRRRILLSGTPMQNDLEEFYSMVNFTNPGILGDAAHFRRYYETPIICAREPTATDEEKRVGSERSAGLSEIVNQFILRRTNALLSNHLPPKIVQVVCCKLSPLQLELYNHFIHSKNVKRAISEETKRMKILAYITALKKLCNHPKLIYDTIKGGSPSTSEFVECLRFFPPGMFSGRSGSWTGGDGAWVELSGKMHFLARLLGVLRQKTDDRIVLVSNYTQTLDLFAQLCRERRYPFLRLDGSTSISKRQKLVNCFNDTSKDEFAFLLSSKAGGCGLNLIGGNRLVLFDPDWNPANDKQAAARVWRDGQKKRVYIYRFLTTGTIEEKVYQRQMSKEGLQQVIHQEQAGAEANFLSAEDLRDLFSFHGDVRSEIHEKMSCDRCNQHEVMSDDADSEGELTSALGKHNGEDIGGFAGIAGCLHKLKSCEKQVGTPKEEDLANWGHHSSPSTVPDTIFQAAAGDEVSFVFTNQVDGKLVPIESKERPRSHQSAQSLSIPKANLFEGSTPSSLQNRAPFLSRSSTQSSAKSKLPSFFKPLQKSHTNKLQSLPEDTNDISLKHKFSTRDQLPLKRLSSDYIDVDDLP